MVETRQDVETALDLFLEAYGVKFKDVEKLIERAA